MLWELLDGDKVRKSIFSVFLYLNRFFPFFLNRERVSLPVKQRAGLSFFTFFSSQVNMFTSYVGVQFVYVNLKNHTLLHLVQICLTAWPEMYTILSHIINLKLKKNNTGSGLTVIAKRREMWFGFFFFISYGRCVKQEFTLTLESIKTQYLATYKEFEGFMFFLWFITLDRPSSLICHKS